MLYGKVRKKITDQPSHEDGFADVVKRFGDKLQLALTHQSKGYHNEAGVSNASSWTKVHEISMGQSIAVASEDQKSVKWENQNKGSSK